MQLPGHTFNSLQRVCRTFELPLLTGALIHAQITVGAGLSVDAPPVMSQYLYTDADCEILYKFDHINDLSKNDPFRSRISYPDVVPTSDVVSCQHGIASDHVNAKRAAIPKWTHSLHNQKHFGHIALNR